jgi:flagellar assembly protein FliH
MTSSKPGPRQVPPPQGATPRSPNTYARFIPREELSGFQAWSPESFGGAATSEPAVATEATPDPELDLNAAPVEPELPPEPAEPTTEEWEARIGEARQQGWNDGYRDGLEALESAKRQFAQQVSAQMGQLVGAFEDQIIGLEDRMAQTLVETAVKLARQVVRAELQQHPECVAKVAQEAINAVMLSARHLSLRLHPNDAHLVESGAREALDARDVQIISDDTITPGGCVVESDLGRVDARIESRWAHAAAVFNVPQGWTDDAAPTAPSDEEGEDAALTDDHGEAH